MATQSINTGDTIQTIMFTTLWNNGHFLCNKNMQNTFIFMYVYWKSYHIDSSSVLLIVIHAGISNTHVTQIVFIKYHKIDQTCSMLIKFIDNLVKQRFEHVLVFLQVRNWCWRSLTWLVLFSKIGHSWSISCSCDHEITKG